MFQFVYCLIKNKSSGLALDVSGANTREGAKIIVWTQHGNENQTWYNDPATGTIRSKMNDYCLDLKGMNKYCKLKEKLESTTLNYL